MNIEFDTEKRNKTLEERGLDFLEAPILFKGAVYEKQSSQLHEEQRFITIGQLKTDIVVVVWTNRGEKRRIISMRKARENEKNLYLNSLAG